MELPLDKKHIAVIGDFPPISSDTHIYMPLFHDLAEFSVKNLTETFNKILKIYPRGYDKLSKGNKRILVGIQDIDIYFSIVLDSKAVDNAISKFLKNKHNKIDTIISCQDEDLFKKTETFKATKAVIYNLPTPKKREYDDSDIEEPMDEGSKYAIYLGILHKYIIKTRIWELCPIYNSIKKISKTMEMNTQS
jgi:hypothetical protein